MSLYNLTKKCFFQSRVRIFLVVLQSSSPMTIVFIDRNIVKTLHLLQLIPAKKFLCRLRNLDTKRRDAWFLIKFFDNNVAKYWSGTAFLSNRPLF